jgi:hypothetical protein
MHTPHNAYATQTVRQKIKNRLQTCNLWQTQDKQSASNVICRQLLPSIVLPMQTLFGKTFYQRQQKKQTACQRQKMSRKKKCRSRAEFHIGTQMKTLRRHEPAAIRSFSHVQIFRRKMRRASCISTIWWGVTVSCSSSHFLCHFDFNLTAGVGPSC